jgi:hypothetical protein
MDRTHSSELHRRTRTHRIDLGHALAMVVMLGLVVVFTVDLAAAAVVGAGIAPAFDQSIALQAQHQLLIHLGPSPTCMFIPEQHDCALLGLTRPEFSIDYLTPHGARSLVWFRLPYCAMAAEISAPAASTPFGSVCWLTTR